MWVSLVAAMMPNKHTISHNLPGTNLPPRDTVKEGGAPTLSDGKPGSLHPPPGVEGVALPVYRGLGGQESLVAPGGEEELLTVCSPDEPYLQAHQVILASPRPFQGPNYGPVSKKMPTNGEVLKWYDSLKECAISEKGWHEEGEKFFGELAVGKKGFKGWMKRFNKEAKQIKYKAHRNIMILLGGTGKQGDIPPSEYCPEKLINEIGKTLDETVDAKEYIHKYHLKELKRAYAKDAWENLQIDGAYLHWLNEECFIGVTSFENKENKE